MAEPRLLFLSLTFRIIILLYKYKLNIQRCWCFVQFRLVAITLSGDLRDPRFFVIDIAIGPVYINNFSNFDTGPVKNLTIF